MPLTLDQQKAMNAMNAGLNVFLTGDAGTGKSYVVNQFLEGREDFIVCAPTGIAALTIGGATLHKVFGLPTTIIDDPKKKPVKALHSAAGILIDEISMCRIDAFEAVCAQIFAENKLRETENTKRARQGKPLRKPLQVILVGDFYQLPPVLVNREEDAWKLIFGKKLFAFESDMWKLLNFQNCVLHEIVRQRDIEFSQSLSLAREGDPAGSRWIRKYAHGGDRIDAVHLTARNRKAEEINNEALDEIPNAPCTYIGSLKGEFRRGETPTFERLTLKPGCRVMLLANDRVGRYANGSFGTVTKCLEDSISVRIDDGPEVRIEKYTWSACGYEVTEVTEVKSKVLGIYEDGGPEYEDDQGDPIPLVKKKRTLQKVEVGTFTQLPVKLAYAITIHKSQGQTFGKVVIDPWCFTSGQLYVALSRVKSIEGLTIEGSTSRLRDEYLICDPKVKEFMKGLEE